MCGGDVDNFDEVEMGFEPFFVVVFFLKYPSNKYGFRISNLQTSNFKSVILPFFGGGVDEGDVGCWKRVRIANVR